MINRLCGLYKNHGMKTVNQGIDIGIIGLKLERS